MPEGQVLEFTHVTKRFNNVTAVSDLSVRVEPGVVTGFLGPNGAGKTTTLRMLLGQIRPTSGTATIGGVSYAELRHPLRTIGAVLEESAYRPRRTAARQLLIAAKANGIPIERVGEVLRLVGLLDDADTRIGGYSLGMRQRLSVATALLGDPGALVLDEPANGLDPEGIRWMRLLMRRLADEGRTVLVSSHVLSEIEQVADHVVVLSKGRSVYAGSIEDLADPSTGAVVVDAEDRDALVGALRAAGLSFDVLRSGVTVRDSDAAAVGAVAASAGIALTTLQQRGPSLEEVFLDLVYGRRADSPRLDKDANPVAHAPNPTEAVTTVPAGDAVLAASGVAAAGVAGAAIVAGADAAADAESADAADAEVVSGDAADEASGEDETAAAETAAADGEAAAESDDAQPETVEATEAEAEAEAGDVESTEATEADETAESADEAESAEGAEDAEGPAAESADDAEATEEPETTDEPEPTEDSEQAAETETDADTTIADAEAADDEPSIEEASADGAEDEVSEETTSEDHATDEADSDQPDAETEDDTTAAETQPESTEPEPTDSTPTRRFPLPGEWAPRAAQGSPAASDDSSPTVLPLATEAVSLPVTTEPASFTELITGIPAAAEGDGAELATTTSSFQIISPVLPTEDDDEESVDDADDPRLAAMRTSLSAAASRFFGGPAPDYPYGDVPKRDEPSPGETENSETSEDDAARVIDTVEPASETAENPENAEHDNGEQHHG